MKEFLVLTLQGFPSDSRARPCVSRVGGPCALPGLEGAWFLGEGHLPGFAALMTVRLEPSPGPSLWDLLHYWAWEALRSDGAARGHPSGPPIPGSPELPPRTPAFRRRATCRSKAGGGRVRTAVRRRILPARSSAPTVPRGAGPRAQGSQVRFPVHGVAGSPGGGGSEGSMCVSAPRTVLLRAGIHTFRALWPWSSCACIFPFVFRVVRRGIAGGGWLGGSPWSSCSGLFGEGQLQAGGLAAAVVSCYLHFCLRTL